MTVKDMCSNETRKKSTDLFLSNSNIESHKMIEQDFLLAEHTQQVLFSCLKSFLELGGAIKK